MEKARETVAGEAARRAFAGEDIKNRRLLTFFSAEPRRLKNRNLQVTTLEWSA